MYRKIVVVFVKEAGYEAIKNEMHKL